MFLRPLQLLDLPGIIEGAKDGTGRGRQVISTARTCNLILIVLDAAKPLTHKKIMEGELEGFGIRLNQTPPNIVFKRKDKGGLNIVNVRPARTPATRALIARISFLVLTSRVPRFGRHRWCRKRA